MLDRTRKAAGWASLLLSLLAFVGLALLPQLGLYRTATVLSNSMSPAFGAGDMVVLASKPLRDVRPGDVIAYAVPVGDHHVVTHRVVEVVEPGDRPVVVTKGDANEDVDPWQARLEGEIAWTHRATIPWAGHAVLFLRQPSVRTTVLYLAPALLALLLLQRIWRLSPTTLRRSTAWTVAVVAMLVPAAPAGAVWTSGASTGGQTLATATVAAPPAPSGTVSCVPQTSISVGLSGPAVADANGYDVLRSTASGGPYSLVGSSDTPSFADTTVAQLTTYRYVVVAKLSAWASAASEQTSVTTPRQANCK